MKRFACTLFLSLFISACAHHGVRIIPIYNAEEEFDRAKRLLDRKKFAEASVAFEQFVFNHGGSALVPDAMYYQGESHFLSRNYTEAIPAFEKVITEYPASAFGDRSQYRLGLCYYKESPSWELDQVMTEKAIEVFRVFLVKYPQSPLLPEVNRIIMACQDKLAHKRWDSGRIYLSMKFYNSARIYFKNTRDEYPESIWSRKAALGLAECDYQEKYYDKARIGFEALLGDSSKVIREKAGSRLKDITVFLDKSFPSKKKK